MKRILSLILLTMLLLSALLSFCSCGFQYHTVGVLRGSICSDFMDGSSKMDLPGYTIDTRSYGDWEEAGQALRNGEIDYLLLQAEEAEILLEASGSHYGNTAELSFTDASAGEVISAVFISGKNANAFDHCRSTQDVLNTLAGMQKSDFQIEWDLFFNKFITHKGYEVALQGLAATMQIAVTGLLIGIVIGTLIAMVKMIPGKGIFKRFFTLICNIYVGFFRGTPMVVQLLIGWFILLPALNLQIDNVLVASLVFGMNSGAYVSEIMRSGIQAVDIGQLEAARALGLGYWTSMLKIVIPQGIKNILPTLGNEFIILVKDTSIVSFIAVVDITKAFRQIGDANYSYIIPYLMLALIYLVIVMGITWLIKLMERRLAKSERNG